MSAPSIRRFLTELVATPSVSGSESRAVRRFLNTAEQLGFQSEIDEAGNGIARRAAASGSRSRQIVLLGHIDTVPGTIQVRIEGHVLHGRGSVDAKGPLATMLFAAARCEPDPDTELVVIGAVGEETHSSPGAHHIVDRFRPDACVIGEPSGWDGVTLGYKGRLVADVLLERPLSHTAGPEASACDALLGWWEDTHSLLDGIAPSDARAFDRVLSTVHGMSSDNDGLTESACLRLGFRLPEACGPEALSSILRKRLTEGMSIEFRGGERAHRVERADPIARHLSASIRAAGGVPRPKLKTGTADLNVVGPAWECPIVAYGPGDSALDHTPEERIDLREVERAVGVLSTALGSLTTELAATGACPSGA
ncbi:MAG: [LysW]-lysine hydrolase [Planctomycetota bacterium]